MGDEGVNLASDAIRMLEGLAQTTAKRPRTGGSLQPATCGDNKSHGVLCPTSAPVQPCGVT